MNQVEKKSAQFSGNPGIGPEFVEYTRGIISIPVHYGQNFMKLNNLSFKQFYQYNLMESEYFFSAVIPSWLAGRHNIIRGEGVAPTLDGPFCGINNLWDSL